MIRLIQLVGFILAIVVITTEPEIIDDNYLAMLAMLINPPPGVQARWLVANSPNGSSYMFIDDGFFGFTDDRDDRYANTFDSLEAAVAAFKKFHS